MGVNIDKIETYRKIEQQMQLNQMIAVEKAMGSENPDHILKANKVLQELSNSNEKGEQKYNFIDPFRFQSYLGFKEKPVALSYNLLRAMSKSPIINIIIRTRLKPNRKLR